MNATISTGNQTPNNRTNLITKLPLIGLYIIILLFILLQLRSLL